MMHYNLRYLSPAEKDLEDIFDSICRDSLRQAAKFIDKIDRSLSRLARFPLSGKIPEDAVLRRKGYRMVVVGNYLAFYKVEGKSVIIYRVLHGKRRYAFLL